MLPLTVLGALPLSQAGNADADASSGPTSWFERVPSVTVLLVFVVALAFLALGSIKEPLRTVHWTLRHADRRGVLGLAVAVAVGGAALLIFWLTPLPWPPVSIDRDEVVDGLTSPDAGWRRAWWPPLLLLVLALVSMVISHRAGVRFRRWRRKDDGYVLCAVDDPAGVSPGWSTVYGLCYLAVLASVCYAWPEGWKADIQAFLMLGLAAGALVLLFVIPLFLPAYHARRVVRRIGKTYVGASPARETEPQQAFVSWLLGQDLGYRFLLALDGADLVLHGRGDALYDQARRPLSERTG